MSDRMIPYSFDELLRLYITEYRYGKTLAGIPVVINERQIPLGPAAGPHTQMAGNLVAAYAAGARYMELKTVQILEGKALGIKKPCIYAGHEVFNTEWSTELTVEEAAAEYIKAYLLIQVLGKEFALTNVDTVHFICSVGYDLAGIQSKKVDRFLNQMKSAAQTEEWKKDISYLRKHMELFSNVTAADIDRIESNACICDTVTLSTMHGCKAEEIGSIAKYLLGVKGFHTYIKMNPTLIGAEETRQIWKEKGYENLVCRDEIFQHDISLADAVTLLTECAEFAKQNKRLFGVKMTNTFPVVNNKEELVGDTMYLSGKALYPLSVNAAALLVERLKENGVELSVSYSGGADVKNICKLLQTGMKPVTVSSVLLQPGGYRNIGRLLSIVEREKVAIPEKVDVEKLKEIAREARTDKQYDYQDTRKFERKEAYDIFCASCNNCVDICLNRANVRVKAEDRDYVLHIDRLCNACGCCAQHCVMGRVPYLNKFTVYNTEHEEVLGADKEKIIDLAKEQGKVT